MNPSLTLCSGRLALLRHELPIREIAGTLSRPNLPATGMLPANLAKTASLSGNSDQSHWDLLLELDNGNLLCWRVLEHPFEVAQADDGMPLSIRLGKFSRSIPVERLSDHRGLYLDYEGPLSGERGWVQRVAQGEYLACMVTGPNFFEPAWAQLFSYPVSPLQRAQLKPLAAAQLSSSWLVGLMRVQLSNSPNWYNWRMRVSLQPLARLQCERMTEPC